MATRDDRFESADEQARFESVSSGLVPLLRRPRQNGRRRRDYDDPDVSRDDLVRTIEQSLENAE